MTSPTLNPLTRKPPTSDAPALNHRTYGVPLDAERSAEYEDYSFLRIREVLAESELSVLGFCKHFRLGRPVLRRLERSSASIKVSTLVKYAQMLTEYVGHKVEPKDLVRWDDVERMLKAHNGPEKFTLDDHEDPEG